jgi:hypothetical protein
MTADMTEPDDIRVEVVPPPGQIGDLGPGDLVDKFSGRAAELGNALAGVAAELRHSFESRIAEPPGGQWTLAEVSVQMSINLEAEAGVIISRAKAGAAFQATLTWSRCRETDGRQSVVPATDAPEPAATDSAGSPMPPPGSLPR